MTITTDISSRTAHLLTITKRGDDAFNSRDSTAMNAVHHPDMIGHMPGNGEPICGRDAHSAAMKQMFSMFPSAAERGRSRTGQRP
jgi:ketosteroid isomerase-like protein